MIPDFKLLYPILNYSLDRLYANMQKGEVAIPRNALIPHSSEMITVNLRQARVLAAIDLCERHSDFCKLQHHDVQHQEALWWEREYDAVEIGSEYVEAEDDFGEPYERLEHYVRLTCTGHAYLRHLKAAIPFLSSDLYLYSFITETT